MLDPVEGTRAFRSTPVRALVIAPASRAGTPSLVAGDTLWGTVREAGITREDGRRQFVSLAFDRVALADESPRRETFAARVVDVPNARERVDDRGRIVGPARPGPLRSRASWAAAALGVADVATGVVAFGVLAATRLARHRHIPYAPGVEMTLTLVDSLTLPARTPPVPLPPVPAALSATLTRAPRFVTTRRERLPADPFTLALVGSEADVAAAFAAAGWTAPARSKLRGDLATLLAAVRSRGSDAQPFTVLELDGRRPTLAFRQVINTMTKRDHLRVWPWGDAPDGRPLWLVAATRDVGLVFSPARRAFTHRVDPHVDVVRDKIVGDLIAAGRVAARSDVVLPRLATPLWVSDGATPVVTDGRLIARDLTSDSHAALPVRGAAPRRRSVARAPEITDRAA